MSEITITDPAGLRAAIDFAEQAGCTDQLGRDLIRLLRTLTVGMTKDNDRKAVLGSDFAPFSMRFAIFDGERFIFNGGWVYDGPGAPGDGSFPSLTVNIGRLSGGRSVHSWNVHT
jgi:hypothetical protein